MLLLGKVFDVLPNGEKWEQSAGRLVAGSKLVGHALVLQCRGDWPFLKLLFLGLHLRHTFQEFLFSGVCSLRYEH